MGSPAAPAVRRGAPVAVASPRHRPPLSDRFGRRHTDLRLSVTDRCDLRCRYCMPAAGVPFLGTDARLEVAELVRVARVAVSLGIRAIRLTGGEPLLRREIVDVVGRLAAITPRPELSLTTNGTRLARLARPLADAGLDRVNVSLDTTREDTFRRITRRNGVERVLHGLAAAGAAGLQPVKVNAVLLRGVNDTEAPELLRFCLDHGYECRFIEQMPLDAGRSWRREDLVTAEETIERLRRRFTLRPLDGRGSDPAERFEVDGGPGRVGVIASVTRPFCAACDRLRVTADGQLRHCLFAREETDLRALLRSGADDAALSAAFRTSVRAKPAGHGIDDPSFLQPARPMSAIGG